MLVFTTDRCARCNAFSLTMNAKRYLHVGGCSQQSKSVSGMYHCSTLHSCYGNREDLTVPKIVCVREAPGKTLLVWFPDQLSVCLSDNNSDSLRHWHSQRTHPQGRHARSARSCKTYVKICTNIKLSNVFHNLLYHHKQLTNAKKTTMEASSEMLNSLH